MDIASVLDMLDRTLVDRIEASATFETASESIRTHILIEDRSFSVDIRSSSGNTLLVTPGRVLASDGTSTLDVLNVDTGAALTAWKVQPPTTYAPLAAGLQQLTTGNTVADQIIGRLAGFSGSLGIGLFPSLCWYSALYPSLTLGDVQLTNVQGRICLCDVVLATDRASFCITLKGEAERCRIKTSEHVDAGNNVVGEDFLELSKVKLGLKVFAYVDLVAETVDVTVERADFDVDKLEAQFGTTDDPWIISASRGIHVAVENLRQKLKIAPANGLSTQGVLTLVLPECFLTKRKQDFGQGTQVQYLEQIRVHGLRLMLNLDTVHGRPDQSSGEARLDRLDLLIHYKDLNLSLQSLKAILQVDSLFFSRSFSDARFKMIDAEVSEAVFVTGPTAEERLVMQGCSIDLSSHFSSNGDRSILLLDNLHLVAAQGMWKLVLESVNAASTSDPLSLRFTTNAGNAIDFFAQQYLSVTGPVLSIPGQTPKTKKTADRIELRVRDVRTDPLIARLILTAHHELTKESFVTLLAQGVPVSILAKIREGLLDVRFGNRSHLLKAVHDRLTEPEFTNFKVKIDAAAVHHETVLTNAEIEVVDLTFCGSLLETTPGDSHLYGKLSFSTLELGFTEVVGLELPTFQNLTGVAPINAGDKYPIINAHFILPQGAFLPGAVAFSQKFDSVEIDIGGAKLFAKPGHNRLRFNFLPQLPILEGSLAQVSIPSATLVSGSNTLSLSNAHVDVYRKTYTPSINASQRSLLSDTVLRFGIDFEPLKFQFQGDTHDFSILGAGISLLKTLLTASGNTVPLGPFNIIENALSNPATGIIGDILGVIGDVTGFGIDDFGIRLQTYEATAQIEGYPDSNRERIAVSVKFRFPSIGAWVRYRWREPRLSLPPWEDKQDTKGFTIELPPVYLKVMLLISYKINAVTHSVDITDVRVKIIPITGTPADLVISAVENLFDAIVPISLIRMAIVNEINELFRIAFPDNLNLDLARIDFDTAGKMTVSVEARQFDWNSL